MKRQQLTSVLFTISCSFSILAGAQPNLNCNPTEPGSEGTTTPVSTGVVSTGSSTYTYSNVNTISGIIGLITGYGSDCEEIFTTIVGPQINPGNFPGAGIVGIVPSDNDTDVYVIENTGPSASHIIRVNGITGDVTDDIVVTGIPHLFGVDVDSSGFVYVVGTRMTADCPLPDSCNQLRIRKYNPYLTPEWTKTLMDENDDAQISVWATTHPDVHQMDFAALDFRQKEARVFAYSTSGQLLWNNSIPIDPLLVVAPKLEMLVDAQCNVYLIGEGFTDAQGNVAVKKFNMEGDFLWSTQLNNSIFFDAEICALTNNLAINTGDGVTELFPSGAIAWTYYGNYSNYVGIDADAFGNIYGLGEGLLGPGEGLEDQVALFKVDSTGGPIYVKALTANAYHVDFAALAADQTDNIYLAANDTSAPFAVTTFKLSQCSDFTCLYNATIKITNVNGADCNNGKIKVDLTGTFNSWPHLELYSSATLIAKVDLQPLATSYTFTNLSSGSYSVKIFDESCCETDISAIVKCPKPASGFSATDITPISAKVNWNATSCNNGYRVQYRKQGVMAWTKKSAAVNNLTITGLTPGQQYQWRVATKCINSNPAQYSAYSAIQAFSTTLFRLNSDNAISSDQQEIDIEISPNPVKDILSVSFETEESNVLIQIINPLGQVVLEMNQMVTDHLSNQELYVSDLPNGIYILELKTATKYAIIKFVKEG